MTLAATSASAGPLPAAASSDPLSILVQLRLSPAASAHFARYGGKLEVYATYEGDAVPARRRALARLNEGQEVPTPHNYAIGTAVARVRPTAQPVLLSNGEFDHKMIGWLKLPYVRVYASEDPADPAYGKGNALTSCDEIRVLLTAAKRSPVTLLCKLSSER